MTFNPAIPQPNQLLSNSQNDLLVNMTALDTVFGIDHYKFSETGSNGGYHNTVTTPVVTPNPTMPPYNHPATLAGLPKFYGMQDSANLGVIQYSRGPNNSAPSPVTILQSPVAAIPMAQNTPITVFDFSGLSRAMCFFSAIGTCAAPVADLYISANVFWTGSKLYAGSFGTGLFFTVTVAGSVLKLTSIVAGTVSAYWSLQFLRTT